MGFGTLLTVLGVLTNFWTLALIVGLLGISAFLYFIPPIGGTARLLKFWMTPSVWIGIAGALALIYVGNATTVIEKQKQEIHQDAVQGTATNDGAAVLTDNLELKKGDAPVKARLRHAIATAKPGDEEDAFLDQIAREQCSDPANHARADCLLKH